MFNIITLNLSLVFCKSWTCIEKLMLENLQEGYSATELDRNREVIIILGNIGTGKSSLSKFLRNDLSLEREQNSMQRLVFTDGEHQIRSTQVDVPKTIIPNVDVDEETGTQIIDYAGFQNSISIDLDLLAAFFNKKILKSSKQVKILIVEEVKNLQKDSNMEVVMQALKRTANLIGDNLEAFEGSVGLIVSKVYDDNNEESIFSEIQNFLQQIKAELVAAQTTAAGNGQDEKKQECVRLMKLLQYINDKEKIRLFRSPGSKSKEQMNRQNMWNMVSKTLSSSKPFTDDFKVNVIPDTLLFVKEKLLEEGQKTMNSEFITLGDALLKNLQDSTGVVNFKLLQEGAQRIKNILKKYEARIMQMHNSLKQLTNFAKQRGFSDMDLHDIWIQVEMLKFLHQADGKDVNDVEKIAVQKLRNWLFAEVKKELKFYSFLNLLIEDFGTYEVQYFGHPIDKEIASLKKENFKEFSNNLRSWKYSAKTERYASDLSPNEANMLALGSVGLQFEQSKVKVEANGGIVTFSGRYVLLSKIKEQVLLERVKTGASEVVVIAAEKLFIDEHLTLQHTHLKFMAPVIQVVKNVVVRLYGEDGRNKEGVVLSCDPDTGVSVPRSADITSVSDIRAGFSSGSFTLTALDLQNAQLLYLKTEGGNGGVGQDFSFCPNFVEEGGAGALPGEQRFLLKNSASLKGVRQDSQEGKNGAPGIVLCTTLSCVMYVNYLKADEFKKLCIVGTVNDANCLRGLSYPIANADSPSRVLNQKHEERNLLEQAFEYHKVFSRMNLAVEEDTSTARFLSFLCTSDQILSKVTPQDFLNAIKSAESNFENADQDDLPDKVRTTHLFYSTMLQSVRRWQQLHADISDTVTEAEVTLISLLDTLHCFLHGKQVVQLSTMVDTQLSRLSDVDKAIEQVGKFDAVISQKKFLLSKIADSEQLLQAYYEKGMKEIKERTRAEFENLEVTTKKMKKHYEETGEILEEHRKELVATKNKNVRLGIANAISIFIGMFSPPVALVGLLVTETIAITSSPSKMLKYDPLYIRGVKYSAEYFAQLKKDKETQQKDLIESAKKIIEADNKFTFLKISNRQKIKELLVTDSQHHRDLTAMEMAPLFFAVRLDLKDRIGRLTDSASDVRARSYLNNANKVLGMYIYLIGAGFEIARTVHQYSYDGSKIDQVDEASDNNKENLKEMEAYGENLQLNLKPLVDQMLKSFDSAQSSVKTQNEFELLIQQLSLKIFARNCILLLQKLTQDFSEKDEGLAQIIADLQDMLNTMIVVYEKIEELRLRVPLVDFVGKMSGIKCVSAAKPEACNALQRTASWIKTNELVRDFAHVYAAYPAGVVSVRCRQSEFAQP